MKVSDSRAFCPERALLKYWKTTSITAGAWRGSIRQDVFWQCTTFTFSHILDIHPYPTTRPYPPWVAVRAAPKRARPTAPLMLARRGHCRACRCRWLLCRRALFWRVCLLRRSSDGCCARARVYTIAGPSVLSMLPATYGEEAGSALLVRGLHRPVMMFAA